MVAVVTLGSVVRSRNPKHMGRTEVYRVWEVSTGACG